MSIAQPRGINWDKYDRNSGERFKFANPGDTVKGIWTATKTWEGTDKFSGLDVIIDILILDDNGVSQEVWIAPESLGEAIGEKRPTIGDFIAIRYQGMTTGPYAKKQWEIAVKPGATPVAEQPAPATDPAPAAASVPLEDLI